MGKKMEEELLSHLSPVTWKSALEIGKEIGADRRVRGERGWFHTLAIFFFPSVDDWFWEPNMGSVFPSLYILEKEGLVVAQWRNDPPEVLEKREGRRTREYRLTRDGFKRRTTILKKSQAIIDSLGVLKPI